MADQQVLRGAVSVISGVIYYSKYIIYGVIFYWCLHIFLHNHKLVGS